MAGVGAGVVGLEGGPASLALRARRGRLAEEAEALRASLAVERKLLDRLVASRNRDVAAFLAARANEARQAGEKHSRELAELASKLASLEQALKNKDPLHSLVQPSQPTNNTPIPPTSQTNPASSQPQATGSLGSVQTQGQREARRPEDEGRDPQQDGAQGQAPHSQEQQQQQQGGDQPGEPQASGAPPQGPERGVPGATGTPSLQEARGGAGTPSTAGAAGTPGAPGAAGVVGMRTVRRVASLTSVRELEPSELLLFESDLHRYIARLQRRLSFRRHDPTSPIALTTSTTAFTQPTSSNSNSNSNSNSGATGPTTAPAGAPGEGSGAPLAGTQGLQEGTAPGAGAGVSGEEEAVMRYTGALPLVAQSRWGRPRMGFFRKGPNPRQQQQQQQQHPSNSAVNGNNAAVPGSAAGARASLAVGNNSTVGYGTVGPKPVGSMSSMGTVSSVGSRHAGAQLLVGALETELQRAVARLTVVQREWEDLERSEVPDCLFKGDRVLARLAESTMYRAPKGPTDPLHYSHSSGRDSVKGGYATGGAAEAGKEGGDSADDVADRVARLASLLGSAVECVQSSHGLLREKERTVGGVMDELAVSRPLV